MKYAFMATMIATSISILSTNAMAADIHKAARKGDTDKVQELITSGADISELDKAVGAPLHWAAARGHVEVARELVAAGADTSQESHAPDLLTPLHLAASGGHLSVVKLLVENGAILNAGEGAVGTPLHSAAQNDRDEVIAYLLDAGADSEAKATAGAYGVYPIHYAAAAGASNAILALLENGAEINSKNDRTGVTALHLAVFNAHPEAAVILLEAGADPHAVSTNIETPAALAKYHKELKEVFLEAGVN